MTANTNAQCIFKKSSHLKNLKSLSGFVDYLIFIAATPGQLSASAELKDCLLIEVAIASGELAVLKSGCPDRRGPTCGDTGRGGRTFPALATPPSNTGVDELLNSGAYLK